MSKLYSVKRIIKDNCSECPYCKAYNIPCKHEDMDDLDLLTPSPNHIPEWCPLPDYRGGKMTTCEKCKYAKKLEYSEESLKLFYSGAPIGGIYPDSVECKRYPTYTIKHKDDWCGEGVSK